MLVNGRDARPFLFVRLRLGRILAALLAALALVWAPGGATAQERPAWVAQARNAMVEFSAPGQRSAGALVAPDKMVTFYHVNPQEPLKAPGREGTVELRGYWQSLAPQNQYLRVSAEFVRKAHVLCALQAEDIVWVQLDEPAPAAITPLNISRRLLTPLWVLPNYPAQQAGGRDVVRAFLVGNATVQPGGPGTGSRPLLRYEAAEPKPGWSGSPILNADGELLGLTSGGRERPGESDLAIMTAWIPSCR